DEYQAYVDKEGFVSNQQARVRMFCLAFVSGSPVLEIGLNDRRRQGKEIVRRKDILPMYTERWIRFENLDFHCTVDKKSFEEEQVVRLSPPDGTFIEICRFRVRPPKNREKPLIVKSLMKIAGSKIEIRIDAMVAAHQQRAKGTNESIRTIPCEDIVIRFPIPEAWIYIFREERHWGVGSVHSKTRRPGKVKNLKDKILGAVQQTESTLIEVAIGEAKYEHVFRAL
uniref:MHD domain-containing protein n=1 Tax=Panagrolaimus sp. ES5 TaxID=591445 RepID=A0AC34GJP7_9BILA